eukprot:m.326957 g.326957  ORF g.326957 m.326957 type:complete len:686 (-) comp16563_c0_seq2:5534-7591(-)
MISNVLVVVTAVILRQQSSISQVSPLNFPTNGYTLSVSGSGFPQNASCRIQSASSSFLHAGYNTATTLLFPARVVNSTHLYCNAPSVIAPGPGTFDVGIYSNGSYEWTNAFNVSYYNLIDFVLSRRPYINETVGKLLIKTHATILNTPINVTATIEELPSFHVNWVFTATNGSDALPFPLSSIPTTFNSDLCITVDIDVTHIRRCRRLQRAAPLPASTTAIPTVVNHETRGILVGGQSFLGRGWYVGVEGNSTIVAGAVQKQAELGINMVMPYQMVKWSSEEQLNFMNLCLAMGVKVMFPMQYFGVTGGVTTNYSSHWKNTSEGQKWRQLVVANVTLMKDHPALLGYYICDDCCPVNSSLEFISYQAQLYNLIKSADPYHITTGAIQCHNAWLWSDVPSLIPGVDNNPLLQLSLDYPMIENYGAVLMSHGDSGTWEGGVQADGVFRHGLEFEPLVNCHGLWTGSTFRDYPAAPLEARSAMWLGIITAGMSDQLVFVLQSATWLPVDSTPGGGWLQTMAVPIWAAHVHTLMPSFQMTFSSPIKQPEPVIISSETLSRASIGSKGQSRAIRVAAWQEGPCETECVHVAVVNVDVENFVQFTISLGWAAGVGKMYNASRLFDAEYNVTVTTDNKMSDIISPGDVHVYEIGCTGAKPKVGEDWQACANRRVLCKHGFVNTDPYNATCQI